MTDLRKAAEMALEALERGTTGLAIRAIPALRQALAQPEQEPVGYWQGEFSKDGGAILCEVKQESVLGRTYRNIPLYTSPPKQWVGLTDEEIKGILDCGRGGLVDIKKAEQILKEKNGD